MKPSYKLTGLKFSVNVHLKKILRNWFEPLLAAIIITFIIKTFFIQTYRIPSGSMEDTLLIGDQLIVLKYYYGLEIPFTKFTLFKAHKPKSGDIIVFKYPKDTRKPFIKRCIAVGGQNVEIINKVVYVDNKVQEIPGHAKFIDKFIFPENQDMPRDNIKKFVVPENCVFMMGDNRDNSNDSRFWGFVPEKNIIGKAWITYYLWRKESGPVAWSIFMARSIWLVKAKLSTR